MDWKLITDLTRINGNNIAVHWSHTTRFDNLCQIWQQGPDARWYWRIVQPNSKPVALGHVDGYTSAERAKYALKMWGREGRTLSEEAVRRTMATPMGE